MIKIRPYITEKSVLLTKSGKYTVLVSGDLAKPQIASILKGTFKLSPLEIKILVKKPLKKKKAKGMTSDRGFKKAIIKLKSGEIFPGFDSFKEEKKSEKDKANKAAKSSQKSQKLNSSSEAGND